jgi:hypothetical protein
MNQHDEDTLLKRLLTLHLIDVMVLPVIMRYLALLGILFLIGTAFLYTIYAYHHDKAVIETYHKENFIKVMLVEETNFTDSKIPAHRNVMVFNGSDSSIKAKQWLKDNEYWSEDEHNWNIASPTGISMHPHKTIGMTGGFDREDFKQSFYKMIEDKDYPPDHIVNKASVSDRKVEYVLVFQEDNMFFKNKKYAVGNGVIVSEDRTGYKEYIDLFLKRTPEELEEVYSEIEVWLP